MREVRAILIFLIRSQGNQGPKSNGFYTDSCGRGGVGGRIRTRSRTLGFSGNSLFGVTPVAPVVHRVRTYIFYTIRRRRLQKSNYFVPVRF